MEKENIFLLEFFEKFKGLDNYDELYKEIGDLSSYRYMGDITIGEFIFPNVGPDPDLDNFYKKIEEKWGTQAGLETKYAIKFFNGDQVTEDTEALLIMELILKNNKYMDLYEQLKKCLFEGEKLPFEKFENNIKDNNIILNSLLFYFLNRS